MNIVFMGTPDFSVPCLEALISSGHSVKGVFCQPDKPKGRGYTLTPPPVKVCALQHDIPVYQPQTMKDGSALEILKQISPELIIVVAYGKILPKEILDLPKYGCINIHASLLPKYRGAAPIQWCIVNGETKTGVTSMQMDVGLDTGDMLISEEIEISDEMNAEQLHNALSSLGAKVLTDTINALENNALKPVKQDDSLSNYAPILTKSLSPIDWSLSAEEIHNKIRGLYPWPSATSKYKEKNIKILESKVVDSNGKPGEIIESNSRLVVSCGNGAIEIIKLQPEGKKSNACCRLFTRKSD